MPTENNGSTTETVDQEQQVQQQATTDETSGSGEQQQDSTAQQQTQASEPVKLPDDHPLVKTLAANKTKIAALNAELSEARAQSAKASQLETDLAARPTQEALDTLQTRYDRLEAFLQASGSPLGKALDSRTFTRELFETDKDIADIVKDWNKANPSATSQALGSAAAAPASKGPTLNEILRAAAK